MDTSFFKNRRDYFNKLSQFMTKSKQLWDFRDIETGKQDRIDNAVDYQNFMTRMGIFGVVFRRQIAMPESHLRELSASEGWLHVYEIQPDHMLDEVKVPSDVAEIYEYDIRPNEFVVAAITF